jgi:hypothetical protein
LCPQRTDAHAHGSVHPTDSTTNPNCRLHRAPTAPAHTPTAAPTQLIQQRIHVIDLNCAHSSTDAHAHGSRHQTHTVNYYEISLYVYIITYLMLPSSPAHLLLSVHITYAQIRAKIKVIQHRRSNSETTKVFKIRSILYDITALGARRRYELSVKLRLPNESSLQEITKHVAQ